GVSLRGMPDFTQLEQLANGNLSIRLCDEAGTNFELLFEGFLAYFVADEGNRLQSLTECQEFIPAPFFTVTNSRLIDYFDCESQGRLQYGDQMKKVLHFVVLTLNEVVDILTMSPPVLRAIED
ncbi:MAG TPA: hypothetical protein PKW90_24300, partial [Myxococcota bacterium]|nr:hypothetical protein [Myxococcota bacterium]